MVQRLKIIKPKYSLDKMGLFEASISYTFDFWKENFSKILLYQLLFLVVNFIAGLLVGLGIMFFVFTSYYPLVLVLAVIFGGIGFILLLVFSFMQLAGYSLMIKRVKEKKKIEITEIFKECFKKSHKILVVGILQSLPMIIFGIVVVIAVLSLLFSLIQVLPSFTPTGAAILPFIGPRSMVTLPEITSILPSLIILIIVFGIVFGYLNLRIWLSLPIFMIEKKACVESVKESWRITKGKCWSIFFTLIVMDLIVWVIEGIIELPFNLLGVPFIGQIITYLIFTPLSLILPTAYYYSIKMEGRKKQE